MRKLFISGENNNHMIACFGENSPTKDSNWVKCWELHSTAGRDFARALGGGGPGRCWIYSRQIFFPLEEYSVSFVSTCLVDDVFQIVISVRVGTALPLPAFTGGSQVHGHAGPCDRCSQTRFHTDSGVVRMFWNVLLSAEWAMEVPTMPSRDLQILLWWKAWPPKQVKSLFALSEPFLHTGESAAACASKTPFLLPSCRSCC